MFSMSSSADLSSVPSPPREARRSSRSAALSTACSTCSAEPTACLRERHMSAIEDCESSRYSRMARTASTRVERRMRAVLAHRAASSNSLSTEPTNRSKTGTADLTNASTAEQSSLITSCRHPSSARTSKGRVEFIAFICRCSPGVGGWMWCRLPLPPTLPPMLPRAMLGMLGMPLLGLRRKLSFETTEEALAGTAGATAGGAPCPACFFSGISVFSSLLAPLRWMKRRRMRFSMKVRKSGCASSSCTSMTSAVMIALTCSRLITSALSRIMMEGG
mmetsp:Transcript_38855/g.96059  ORF Transcript_38855/g.96059 Transcript_38855/m.96059 type:complete len:276 (-) Transcript_38855:505-1332(-)